MVEHRCGDSVSPQTRHADRCHSPLCTPLLPSPAVQYKGMGGFGRHKFKGGKFKRPRFGFKGKRGKRWGRGKWK